MIKNNPFRKSLAVAVIILFIGVAFAPSINADIGRLCVDKVLNPNKTGYNITETLIGIICCLSVEENHTSFLGIYGIWGIYSVRDDGGIAIGIGHFLFDYMSWSGDFEFRGILRPHFILGRVYYRRE